MVQLKTEPSSPGLKPRKTGKPKSVGTNGVFGSSGRMGESFSSILAKAVKAMKGGPGEASKSPEKPAEKGSAQAEKRASRREGPSSEADSKRAVKAKNEKSPAAEKGAESGFRPDAAAVSLRDYRDIAAPGKQGAVGEKSGAVSVSARTAGKEKVGDKAASAGIGLFAGIGSKGEGEPFSPNKANRPPKAKDEAPRVSKSPRDSRMERLREKLKEKPKEGAAPERFEQKDAVPLAAADDQKKDGPKETFELRVTDRSGVLERVADEKHFRDGREAREVSSQILKQLKEDGNASVVRSARIVLRDRDEGEIRLILKPERLGEVRIRLHLQDRLIDGRILVENSTVREAFEQNLQDLAAAFRESGFELGNLDVSVGNGGEGRSERESPKLADGRKAAELERSVPRVEALKYYASNSVNIMV